MTDTERRQVAAVLRAAATIVNFDTRAGVPQAEELFLAWRSDGARPPSDIADEMRAAADRVEKGEL